MNVVQFPSQVIETTYSPLIFDNMESFPKEGQVKVDPETQDTVPSIEKHIFEGNADEDSKKILMFEREQRVRKLCSHWIHRKESAGSHG